jgi:hypothetical protein
MRIDRGRGGLQPRISTTRGPNGTRLATRGTTEWGNFGFGYGAVDARDSFHGGARGFGVGLACAAGGAAMARLPPWVSPTERECVDGLESCAGRTTGI